MPMYSAVVFVTNISTQFKHLAMWNFPSVFKRT